jgi:splicing factor 45
MDETPDEIFARRMRMSQMQQAPPPPPPPQDDDIPPPPPPALPTNSIPTPAGTISRAPVRYNLPAASPDIPATEEELEQVLEAESAGANVEDQEPSQRTSRPGQKGFAERLMSKYGWTKGSGLGASGTGITSALRVKVEKKNAGHGKIIGVKREAKEEEGKFGAMSEVVLLKGMVDNLDLEYELGPNGTLIQEIGEECGEKVCVLRPFLSVMLTMSSMDKSREYISLEIRRSRESRSLSISQSHCLP